MVLKKGTLEPSAEFYFMCMYFIGLSIPVVLDILFMIPFAGFSNKKETSREDTELKVIAALLIRLFSESSQNRHAQMYA